MINKILEETAKSFARLMFETAVAHGVVAIVEHGVHAVVDYHKNKKLLELSIKNGINPNMGYPQESYDEESQDQENYQEQPRKERPRHPGKRRAKTDDSHSGR